MGGLLTVLLLSVLGGCSESAPPTPTPTVAEQIVDLQKAVPINLTPEEVAEAFALGSKSTDLQRDLLTEQLIGSVVEWRIQVYEVDYTDGLYTVISQPIPTNSPDAVALLRVFANVVVPDETGHAAMRTVKTDQWITIRGRVEAVRLRTMVDVSSAMLVAPLP